MLSCIAHQILFEVMTHLDNTDNIEKKKNIVYQTPIDKWIFRSRRLQLFTNVCPYNKL